MRHISYAFSRHFSGVVLKLFFAVFLSIFLLPNLMAEGSKDFRNYPGYRLFLDTRHDQQFKVYAKPGEFLNVGASHIGFMAGFIRIYEPSGNLYKSFSDPISGIGIINNDVQEMAGPTGGGTTNGPGYVPGVVEVPADGEGIWTVIIDFPTYGTGNFTNILNSDPWTRMANQPQIPRVVLAWDITVSQGAAGNMGGTLLEGRVYSNEYISIINQNNFKTSPIYYILTKDGFIYEVDFDEADPFRFPISSNSSGFVTNELGRYYNSQTRGNVIRSDDTDSWLPDSVYYYEPQAQDLNGDELINNKVFFNPPNSDMPSQAFVTDIFRNNSHMTWLYNEPSTLTVNIDSFEIVALSGSSIPCEDGTIEEGIGGNLNFSSTLGGTAELRLDLNNDLDFTDPVDRILTQIIDPGTNSIFWDGKDGNGDPIPTMPGFVFNYEIEVRGGEAHIIMEDIENNFGGVTFQWVNNMGMSPNIDFYYDHSQVGGPVSGGGTPGNALPTMTPYVYINQFGNEKYLNYWLFVPFTGLGQGTVEVDILDDCAPQTPEPDYDGDGVSDYVDIDDENDGVPDLKEYCNADGGGFACLPGGLDPGMDMDNDDVPNFLDADDPAVGNPCEDQNNDGICDAVAAVYDTDGDNIPDHLDADSDNDGITDLTEAGHGQPDADGDGIIDSLAGDFGLNGLFNPIASDPDDFAATETYVRWDWDNDGVPDHDDLDSDNDGINDVKEGGFGDLDADLDGRIDVGNPAIVTQYGIPFSIAPSQTGVPIPQPFDKDTDLIPDWHDLDSDNDSILDAEEGGNPDPDDDGIIGSGTPVVNTDGQATEDENASPLSTTSAPLDSDGDDIEDFHDLDSDNDGINDVTEASRIDPDENGLPGTGIPNVNISGIPTSDNNGETFTGTSNPDDTDNDNVRDFRDLDADNDGINDVIEGGNPDPDGDGIIGKDAPVVNNDGQATEDGNGVPLSTTSSPTQTDGDNIPDFRDLDTDNDGINDVIEGGNPDDDNDGIIGTNMPVVNDKGQATEDGNGDPVTPTSNPNDTDTDGVRDFRDLDTDNDGINDVVEGSNPDPDGDGIIGQGNPTVNPNGQATEDENGIPLSTTSDPDDTDTDGVRDFRDLDTDNDGINDVVEGGNPDPDGDGIIGEGTPVVNPDGQATEDGNGNPTSVTSNPTQTDADNVPDYRDLDADDDGVSDVIEGGNPDPDFDDIIGEGTPVVNSNGQATEDANGDPISPTSDPTNTDGGTNPDFQDLDADDDGIPDMDECPDDAPCVNGDGDDNPDFQDIDRDNDGINDEDECETSTPCPDTDGDGILDVDDLDTDNDGILDEDECPDGAPCPDSDMDGTPDWREFECNPLTPVPSIDTIIGATTFCFGDDALISINFENYDSLVTYNVTGPNGFDTTATPNPAGSFEFEIANIQSGQDGTYEVILTSAEGCPGDSMTFELGLIDMSDAPVILASENEVCVGQEIILTTGSVSGNNVTYEWFFNDGNGVQSISVTTDTVLALTNIQMTEIGDYWVTASIGSCASPQSNSVNINVLDGANVPAFISPIDNDICIGQDLEIIGNTVMEPNVTYEWYFDDGLGGGPQFIFSSDTSYLLIEDAVASDSGFYTMVVNVDGCSSEPSNPLLMSVSNNLDATPFMQVLDDNLCEGQTLFLQSTDPTGEATEFEWFFNDGMNVQSLGSTTTPNFSLDNFSFGNEGNYFVQIKIGGCVSNNSNNQNVTVSDIAGETPTISVSDNVLCEADSFLMTSSVIPGTGILYDWYFDDGSGPQIVATTGQNVWLFSDLTTANTGVYTVIASDGGCESQVSNSINIEVTDILNQTPTLTFNSNELCDGETLELNVTSVPGGADNYDWYFDNGNGPVLISSTNIPTLFIDPVNQSHEGFYTVFASMGGCTSQSSNAANIMITNVLSDIPTISADADVICVGETIELNSTPIPGSSVIYEWFFDDGNGWVLIGTTNLPTLFINNTDLTNTGIYSVVASNGGCSSQPSNAVDVTVTDIYFETPTMSVANDQPCIGELLELNASVINGANVTYEWFFDDGSGPVSIATTTVATHFINNAPQSASGIYSVVVHVGGCTSPFSNSVDVTVTDVLNEIPIVSADQNMVCAGETIELTCGGNFPNGAMYEWFFDDGNGPTLLSVTVTPNQFVINATPDQTGIYSVSVTVGGCQSPVSNGVFVEVTTHMSQTPTLTSNNSEFCSGEKLTLTASPISGNNVMYEWYFDDGSGPVLLETTANASLIIDNLTPANTGEYTLIARDGDCVSGASNAIFVEVFGVEEVTATNSTSEDMAACIGDIVTLTVPQIPGASYQWNGPNGFNSTTSTALIPDAKPEDSGDYFAVITTLNCVFTSSTTTVYVTDAIYAEDDIFDLNLNEPVQGMDILANDDMGGIPAWTVSIITPPEHGTAEVVDGNINYTPDQNYFGADIFIYEVCDVECPDNCAEATVRLNIKGQNSNNECFVPNIMTPNGDGKNDLFIVPCLNGDFENNRLKIFNRWGDEVHQAAPYKNDWDATFKGKPLPAGTYFYLLFLTESETDCLSGYFTITR